MIKQCPHCKQVLDESYFNWKIKGKQLAAYCKDCSRKYIRSHYARNQQYYLNKARKRRSDLKAIGVEYITNYLKSHPCVDCGETDIVVLEFDHRERREKGKEISKMLNIGFQLDKLIKEISKCDVRCANCHRRKTHAENGSWKSLLMLKLTDTHL